MKTLYKTIGTMLVCGATAGLAFAQDMPNTGRKGKRADTNQTADDGEKKTKETKEEKTKETKDAEQGADEKSAKKGEREDKLCPNQEIKEKIELCTVDMDKTTLAEFVERDRELITIVHVMNTAELEQRAKQEEDEWLDEQTQSELTCTLEQLKSAKLQLNRLQEQDKVDDDLEFQVIVIGVGEPKNPEMFADKVETYFDEHGFGDVQVLLDTRNQLAAAGLRGEPSHMILRGARIEFYEYSAKGKEAPTAMKAEETAEEAEKTAQKAEKTKRQNHLRASLSEIAQGQEISNPQGCCGETSTK